jgi:hypothetical protein
MKLQRPLAAIAVLLAIAVSAFGALSSEQKRARLRNLHPDGSNRMNLSRLDRAYLDVRSLLSRQSKCADFFGGSAVEQVLEDFVIELRTERFGDTSIGIRMSGAFRLFEDSEHNLSYRLFATEKLNTEGPFFRAKVFAADPYVPAVGSFAPNTREVRALILLHELAHLIRARNGAWLIPDDGYSPQLSRLNTSTVESRCGRQIRAL